MVERDQLKDKLCTEKSIRLLRVLESEWLANPESVIERLRGIIDNG